MHKEILKFCLEKGFLVDNSLLEIFSETSDINSVKLIIEKVGIYTGQNVLTRDFFEKHKKELNQCFLSLPEENQKNLERLKVKLGLSIEISRETEEKSFDQNNETQKMQESGENVMVLTPLSKKDGKLEVSSFVNHFKNRFLKFKEMLQERSELDHLVSIDKISGSRKGISVIGMVYDKQITKNKNLVFEVEDFTGRIKLLVNRSKKQIWDAAQNICLDSVVGFKCSGNREILFVNEIILPDASLPERKKSPIEEYALFIGDLHYGSKLFLKENFSKFISYLNGNLPGTNADEIKKIKYLFIVGDLVAGVGVYPNQELELSEKDLEMQYLGLAEMLKEIPKRIKIVLSPGNHDGVRIMEPQPIFDEKYAWPLYQLENVFITENPSRVNIGKCEGFPGFEVLTYHGFSYPYYANVVPTLIFKKAMNCPEEIMKYLLSRRHLAPTHASTQYHPSSEDKLLIRSTPDIFVSGHTHKCGVTIYNNILIISTSCWEAMTSYQEKFGNEPDHCKVPMLNLKTSAVKILDFEDADEN